MGSGHCRIAGKMTWSTRRRWFTSGVLLLAASAGLGWMLFEQAHVQRAHPVTSAGQVSGVSASARSGESTVGDESELNDVRRPVGPNVVTHVDETAVWNLPEDERAPFLASLRSLAEAGWSEAFLALAPVASRCILRTPPTDALIIRLYNPDDGLSYRHLRVEDESPSDRAAMREERMARMEREREQAMRKRERCDNALGDDPDEYMQWLEQALIQQPPGFFVAMLDDLRMVPTETGWMVRNAERLARFNLGFLNALRARVVAGDPKVVGRAWKAFAGRQFMPEPDPVQAWAHGLVARRLPEPWSEPAPTDADYQRLVEAGLDPEDIGRAREMSETLWRRCCATSIPVEQP